MSLFAGLKRSPKKARGGFRAPFVSGRFLLFGASVPPQVLSDFFDHLATLLASGIPLLQALEFTKNATRNKRLTQAIGSLSDKIRSGAHFSDAMGEHPEVFDHIVLGMVRAAEASGHMETICQELARSFAQRAEVRNRLTQALAYPSLVAVAGALTVCVLLIFVVPKLTAVFELWETPLPLITRILLSISTFLSRGGFLILLLVFVGLILALRFTDPKLRRRISFSIVTRVPFLKDLFFLKDFVHLTRTWGMLLRSGVPLIAAIRSSKDVLWNLEIREEMNQLQEKMIRGGRFEEAIRGSVWFPEMAQNILSVGSTTGTLVQSFEKVAFFYEKELDRKMRLMATFLEPLLILTIGLVVG
ncbi:MAG: type II secretion system F family protein, partial [Candidatus Omnitrophica bacterium]|nr:type II secretion system F family protein [Candidatus Omnitrophota bacterium]